MIGNYGLDLASQLRAHYDGHQVLTGRAEQVVEALASAGLRLTAVEQPQAEGAGETCPTCATRPADLTIEQQPWRHHHCRDGCPGHWVHEDNLNPATCGGAS